MTEQSRIINRARPRTVALETTLLVHGVPRGEGAELARRLSEDVRAGGGNPAIVGIISGTPIVGMTDDELAALLQANEVRKVNTANLGVAIHRREHAATTVSTTMELCAGAGVRLFATGGLGGVHRGYAESLDISADLAAFTRFPVAVVTSGVKSLLDVSATREALESLGITVVGFRTDRFPAFYLRESESAIDARFDDEADLARFLARELHRSGRGIVVCNPIPHDAALDEATWEHLLRDADREVRLHPIAGREVTPAILGALHRLSGGRTLHANIALARSNAALAGRLAGAWTEESF